MFFFKKKKYLNWPEYMDRITTIDALMFMSRTTKQAANNHWEKEERKWFH
jgi:hypothetical protein